MATYSAITNGEIDADSPVTEALLRKYRDNPFADFEGDGSGVAFAALADITPGNIELDGMQIMQPPSTSYSMMESFTVYKAGTYRVVLSVAAFTSHTTYARIYRNGTAVGTARSVSGLGNSGVYTEDIAFSVGDTIEIWGRTSAAGYGVGVVCASIRAASAWHVSICSPVFDWNELFGAFTGP